MPIMNGLETTRKLRQMLQGKINGKLCVIGLTGDTSPGTEQACKEAGMDRICNHPFLCLSAKQRKKMIVGKPMTKDALVEFVAELKMRSVI